MLENLSPKFSEQILCLSIFGLYDINKYYDINTQKLKFVLRDSSQAV